MVEMFATLKGDLVPMSQPLRWLAHVHLGLAIYLLVATFSVKGLRSPLAMIVLVLMECINEALDLSRFWPEVPAWLWADSANDMLHTLFWPGVLFFGAQWRHWDKMTAQSEAASSAEAAEPDDSSSESSPG